MSKTVRIAVLWWEGEEFLEFDPDVLKRGTIIKTTEFWPDEGIEVTYRAKCMKNERSATGRTIQLLYDRHLNPKLKDLAEEISWGTTTIFLTKEKAEATYVPVVPDDVRIWPAVRCQLLSANIFSARQHSLVQVVQRAGQQRLRSMLLKSSAKPRCAISNETILTVLDAAHIVDDNCDGAAETTNGLLLRADLHRLFDARPKHGRRRGTEYMNITGKGMVIFSPSLRKHPSYMHYHGKPMTDGAAFRRVKRNLIAAEKLHSAAAGRDVSDQH